MSRREVKQKIGKLFFGVYGLLWRLTHPRRKFAGDVQSVLILNLLKIGDTIVTLPTLEAIRKLYPKAKITLVTRNMVSSLVKHLDSIDELIVHDGDASWSSCKRLIPRLPETDLAVVLDTSPWVSWAAAKAKAKKIIAYNSLNRAFAATDRIKAPPMWNVALWDYEKHWNVPYQGDAWLELADELGAVVYQARPSWNPPKKSLAHVKGWLHSRGINEFFLIHPGSDESYLWSTKKYKKVIAGMINWPVVIGGGPEDKKLLEEIAHGDPRVHVWCGDGSLADYGALLSMAQHVLSVDTSAAHLAAAVETPVTVLFGPGDPQIWAPRGSNTVDVIQGDSKCLGCKSAVCLQDEHMCMPSISIHRVWESIKKSC